MLFFIAQIICALEDIIQPLLLLVIQKVRDKEFLMLYSKPDTIVAHTPTKDRSRRLLYNQSLVIQANAVCKNGTHR